MKDARSLEAFYTRGDVAAHCLKALRECEDLLGIEGATYLEPSAGNGAFYGLLPADRRMGVDVEPMAAGIERADFLTWSPPKPRPEPLVAVGNPPFGFRGSTALRFLERASRWCCLIGMVLPFIFDRPSAFSPARRIRGLARLHSERLPDNAFVWPDGSETQVIPAVFQVWARRDLIPRGALDFDRVAPMAYEYVRVVSLRNRGGYAHPSDCDLYIRSPAWDNFRFSESVDWKLGPHVAGEGLGVYVKRERAAVIKCLMGADARAYARPDTRGAWAMAIADVHRILTDAGFVDRRLL